jgi:hypothetical protein
LTFLLDWGKRRAETNTLFLGLLQTWDIILLHAVRPQFGGWKPR